MGGKGERQKLVLKKGGEGKIVNGNKGLRKQTRKKQNQVTEE